MTASESKLVLSPLTDPRSLASTLFVHSALLLIASLAAWTVTRPEQETLPSAMRGELDPVDNRDPSVSAGGGPGELGGEGLMEALPSAGDAATTDASREPAADALLSEVLPSLPSAEASPRALPGPQTGGFGVLPGPGLGGGGGSGGGSGGGVGRGVGPGTEFFGAREHAGSFAYVVDSSGSMASRGSLDVAKGEMWASLNQLPPDARFAIVLYNLHAIIFADPQGRKGLMPATAANKARVRTQLAAIAPDGGTDHQTALRAALAMRPEVIFFLTDADLMTESDVVEIKSRSQGTRIQAIEFGRGANLGGSGPLRKLTNVTGGSYRYIDVMNFPKPPG
jgi:hypothetical protein